MSFLSNRNGQGAQPATPGTTPAAPAQPAYTGSHPFMFHLSNAAKPSGFFPSLLWKGAQNMRDQGMFGSAPASAPAATPAAPAPAVPGAPAATFPEQGQPGMVAPQSPLGGNYQGPLGGIGQPGGDGENLLGMLRMLIR